MEDSKLGNLDAFFDKQKDDSPRMSPQPLKFDYKDINTFNFNQEYQHIIEQSKNLQKAEHIEIFKIIDSNGDDYTCNDNGVFVALNKLKPETLTKIRQFIDFCLVNKNQLEKDLNKRDEIRGIMNCQNDEIRGFNKIFLLSEKN